MKITSSSGVFNAMYYNVSYLLLFRKKKKWNFMWITLFTLK